MTTPDPLLQKLRESLQAGTFVKFTLSAYAGAEKGLRNVYARPVELRGGPHLSFLWRYATRDVTKNFPPDEAPAQLEALLRGGFERAHLFTRTGDWQWQKGRKLKASRPAFVVAPPAAHDRPKLRGAEIAHAPFLRELGLTNALGEARPGGSAKLRQIQHFVELLGHLAEEIDFPEGRPLRVLDLGSGKGYLTFALAEFLRQRGVAAEVTGVEVREDLVGLCQDVAAQTGFHGLRFVAGRVHDYTPAAPPDWIIALHACNTATDDAIAQGLAAGSELIVVAPCCHQEIRPQMVPPAVVVPMLRHGILLEREAAQVTDALRALVLESCSYQARVIEFISAEHTDKNLLITAQKRRHAGGVGGAGAAREQLHAMMAFYGIREQRLVRWLESHEAAS